MEAVLSWLRVVGTWHVAEVAADIEGPLFEAAVAEAMKRAGGVEYLQNDGLQLHI